MFVTLFRSSNCVTISLACLLLGRTPLSAQGEQGGRAVPAPKTVAQLIEAIANKNKAPQLIGDRRNGKKPLFPEDYDWAEQGRVDEALDKLKSSPSEDLWEELIRKSGDKRYCLTEMNNSGLFALGNSTVGGVCHSFAWDLLLAVADKNMPKMRKPTGRVVSISWHVGIEPDLVTWRKKRAEKRLYELQIEICENALKDLKKVEGIPQAQIDEARKGLEADVARMKRTKEPILVKPQPYPMLLYTPEEAKSIRETLSRER